ncbi:cysteine/glutathione ABC transporter ATP-binding protein/permease CydC [Arsenophonus sp. aPb]|uniref:heme ABC transporter ATP-binding protein/permease CydC n=1 Tax=Arsenophonus sp. aPb TaxID=3041619 RepID=UPI002468949C|nr:cysteine/glutathione ABC transporter ATP-binding protein/permease CydC [Arsenophonus sp. aPb]WGL99259.1 cysteine/glutathione ABC transporter ATP-binding protein/permease CydC [Arsenophonus sp. aPb]
MRVLLPFLALYRRHWLLLNLGILLTIIAVLASISLLTLSGWFLAGTALAGTAGLYTFNYMLPAAGVRGSAIIRTASRYAERLVNHDATFRVLAHLRVFTFQKLFPLSPGAIAHYRQGDILNCLVADVESLDHLYLRVLSPIFAALVITILLTLSLSTLDLLLALTLGTIMLCLLITLPFFFYQAGKSIGHDLTIFRSQYRAHLINIIQAQAELTVFGALPRFRQVLTNLEFSWLKRQQQQSNLTALSQSIVILISGLTATLLMWLAATGVGEQHKPGALIALFVFCTLAAFEVLGPVAVAFQYLGQVVTSANRLMELINQQPAVTFPTSGITASNKVEIKLQNVHFSYPQQPQPTLQNICLTLNAGEHIALLGKTGCGKSTLLQLLTRAWDVSSGQILINGQPINHYNEKTLRKLMAVVPQRTHIFSDTLRNNLLIAKDDASDTLLTKVLEQVGLDSLIKNQGLDSWIGEGGRQLSGGEQRRLGIARALLYDAPVILLDEPTEGLDAKTEKQILIQLQQHCCDKTLLVITHRLQGLEKMDQIYVMDDGKIIEQATHEELLQLQGRYFQYYQARIVLT